MHIRNRVVCFSLFAITSVQAQEMVVPGNLTVNGNAVMLKSMRIEGPVGIGVKPSGGGLQVLEPGTGVGIFLGDRKPFGQALIETDLTAPATHAWFAENGNRVFSVAKGGDGFFNGSLDVGGDANIDGAAHINRGEFFMGSDIAGSTSELRVYGERVFPALAPSRFTILANGNIGVGTFTPTQKLHIAGNAKIDQILQIGDIPVPIIGGTINPNNPKLQVGGDVAITGNVAITGGVSGKTAGGLDGVYGESQRPAGNGVRGFSPNGVGVRGESQTNDAVVGFGHSAGKSGVFGLNDNPTGGNGVAGISTLGTGNGIFGASNSTEGVGGRFTNNAAGGIALRVDGVASTSVLQITGGADLAEPFNMSCQDIPKGAVVIIDEEHAGHLKLSEGAYDTRVAGIVSGANGINPGISLSQQGVLEGGQNVALSGRVYVLADASSSAIRPGDLLTTSDIPGYAMKVIDHGRAHGAVIGKAMSAMTEGQGMVLVLVSLQ